jgi:hypothetical protein
MLQIRRPLKFPGDFLQLLELHRQLALADLVIGELLEMARETEDAADADEPLGWVVLVPLDGITVVGGELVVEVVVSLADRNECGDDVVSGSVLVIERSLSKPVSERVDAEGRVVHKGQTSRTGKEQPTPPIAPQETRNDSRDDETHDDKEGEVHAMLPPDNGVLVQVGHVGDAGLATGLDNHPADVRPEEAVVCAVGVEVGVGVAVVCAMATAPPFDRPFDGSGSGDGEEETEDTGSVV